MQFAKRLEPLKFNVFAAMDRAKAEARAAGQNVIDLSLGSSDLPAAAHITDAIARSLSDSKTHGYLLFNGTEISGKLQLAGTRKNLAFQSIQKQKCCR